MPYTRHKLDLTIPTLQSTSSDELHSDKAQLRSTVLETRAQGMSYREIGRVVGLHWTRIQQIVRNSEAE